MPIEYSQAKKMLNEIQFVRLPCDPLIIKLNRNMYWNVEGRGLTCRAGLKVDNELFNHVGEPYHPKPCLYGKVQHLALNIKHAIVEFV